MVTCFGHCTETLYYISIIIIIIVIIFACANPVFLIFLLSMYNSVSIYTILYNNLYIQIKYNL